MKRCIGSWLYNYEVQKRDLDKGKNLVLRYELGNLPYSAMIKKFLKSGHQPHKLLYDLGQITLSFCAYFLFSLMQRI